MLLRLGGIKLKRRFLYFRNQGQDFRQKTKYHASTDILEIPKVLKGRIFVDNQQIVNLKAEPKRSRPNS